MWYPALTVILLLTLFHPSSPLPTLNATLEGKQRQITAKRGAVATDDYRCSKIGTHILKKGGHAVDAAVASALCLGVVSSASSGIGGGAFMLVRQSTGNTKAFDMRETAPLRAFANMYSGNGSAKAHGALSVAVPGELAGLHHVWKQYGKLPWRTLVKPAEKLAGKGYKISPYLYTQMIATREAIMADEGLHEVFTSKGELLKPGKKCRNNRLAETLRIIGEEGPEPFYNGSIGIALVKEVQNLGGILTMTDLREYRVRERKPISVEVMGHEILSMPPPSSGGVGMPLVLNILAEYGLPGGVSGPLGVHRFIEALKHMFAVRMNLGDPDFVDIGKVVSDMLSKKFAKELRELIYDNQTFNISHYGGKYNQIHDHGTSHLSIVDKDRNTVSMTTTVNGYFGSHILSPSTGILLNNEMDDFSMPGGEHPPPAPRNFVKPAKRPLSSMTPTIVLKDGQLKAVVGASGGLRIIAGTTQVFLNYFGRGMGALEAVMEPRTYHELIPNVVEYEDWTPVSGDHIEVPEKTREVLRKKGHDLQSLSGGTISQFIVHDLNEDKDKGKRKGDGETIVGSLTAVSDPRKGGFPSGY